MGAGLNDLDCISDAELFLSDHEQDVEVESIQSKIEVLTLEQYTAVSEQDYDVFFTRAKYVTQAKRLYPEMKQWKT